MKTLTLFALFAVSFAACGGQVGSPATEGGDGLGTGEGSGYGTGEGSGYGSGEGSGYGTGTGYGYGTGYGSGTGYGYGTGYGTGTGYGYGTGTGSGYGYGSGTGTGDGCGPIPPGGGACGVPYGCSGGLVCEGDEWVCEIFECTQPAPDAGACYGEPPYCVNGCGEYEASYCDGDGNWACPPTPPCITEDAGFGPPPDAGVVIGVPTP
jgi:hypothetical protein